MHLKKTLLLAFSLPLLLASCQKEELSETDPQYRRMVVDYGANKGQISGRPAYYQTGWDSLRARILLEELPLSQTRVTVSLFHFPVGNAYPVRIHRATDTTAYGYVPVPDEKVFGNKTMTITGPVTTDTFRAAYSYDYLTRYYHGYFIVRDPNINPDLRLDTFSTARYPIFGTFAR